MGKLAFIFPGQGAQYVGMGKDIAGEYKSADAVFDAATEALGFDIKEMIFNGDDETLKITENTQPTIVTTSVACMQPLLDKGIKPDFVAGLSLGEYAAHVAAGTMSFTDAVALVRKRGKFMQEAVPVGVGAMSAIIGLDNCPGQLAIAGEVAAVEKANEICKAKGAKRAMMLAVSAPFHCSLLRPAGEKLAAELEKITLNDMKVPVVVNVSAKAVTNKEEVKETLIKQVSTSVLWENCVKTMIEQGVDTFVEIGPGKVLSGFVKKINKDVRVLNVENIESLNTTLEELSK